MTEDQEAVGCGKGSASSTHKRSEEGIMSLLQKNIHFEMENFGAFAVVLTIHLNFRQSRATLNYRQIPACEQTASLESVQGSGACHA